MECVYCGSRTLEVHRITFLVTLDGSLKTLNKRNVVYCCSCNEPLPYLKVTENGVEDRGGNPLCRKVFGTKWDFNDVVMIMGPEYREKFQSLPREKQQEIIKDYIYYSIGKGMESGIMEQWETVLKTAVEESGLYEKVEEAFREEAFAPFEEEGNN